MSLLCAYRKLTLTRELSRRELLGIVLSQKNQRIMQRIGDMQKANSSVRSSMDSIMKGATSMANMAYQAKLEQNNSLGRNLFNDASMADSAYRNKVYENQSKGTPTDADKEQENQLRLKADNLQRSAQLTMMNIDNNNRTAGSIFQASQLGMAGVNNVVGSIFESVDGAMMDTLQKEQADIQMDLANNSSMMELEKAELENVKKEEKDSIKRDVATFGLD